MLPQGTPILLQTMGLVKTEVKSTAQWLQQVLKPKPKMLVFIAYNENLSHSDHDSEIQKL